MSLPTLPPALFTQEDARAFREPASGWRQAIDEDTGPWDARACAYQALGELAEQDAWLLIEETFLRLPSLEEMVVDTQRHGDGYIIGVSFCERDDEDEDADEDVDLEQEGAIFQAELADKTERMRSEFMERLDVATIRHDRLEQAAAHLLGDGWASARKAQSLDLELPPGGPQRRRSVL